MIHDCESYRNGQAFAVARIRAYGVRLASEECMLLAPTSDPTWVAGMLDATIAAVLDARFEGRL